MGHSEQIRDIIGKLRDIIGKKPEYGEDKGGNGERQAESSSMKAPYV